MDAAKIILSRDETRELDRKAILEYEIPGIILMENAGRNVVEEILKMLPEPDKTKVAIFSGKGNNGGDGFVIARHLYNKGIAVSVFITTKISNILNDNDASTNLKILLNMNIKIKELGEEDINGIEKTLRGYNLIVDAIFGTGLSGEVREPVKSLIMNINKTKTPIVSVDIPSGLDCDEGTVLGAAINATKTVTFVAAKKGFFKECGKEHTGDLIVTNIGIPQRLVVASR